MKKRRLIKTIRAALVLVLVLIQFLGAASVISGAAASNAGSSAQREDSPAASEKTAKTPRKVAYLTFDDGPSRVITPKILDVLKNEGINATFFVLPHNRVDDLYMRIIDEGHEIGNHSYSHQYASLYDSRDLETFRNDVLEAQAYILDNFGYLTTSYRFPGGSMGHSSAIIDPRRSILKELGYSEFGWNADTGDARVAQKDKSAAALTANVLQYTRGREQLIVLMHDTQSKSTTLEALPRIIQGLRNQGYTFDILSNYSKFNDPLWNRDIDAESKTPRNGAKHAVE